MRIRGAAIADSRAIGKVQLESWHTMFPDAGISADAYLSQFTYEEREEDWHDLLTTPDDQIVYVAEADSGEVVGFALGRPESDPDAPYKSELASLHILPAYRGQGIGQQLIATIAKHLKRQGCLSLWLWVLAGNRARHLYERLGGQAAGEHRVTVGKNEVGIEIDEVAYAWANIDVLCTKASQ